MEDGPEKDSERTAGGVSYDSVVGEERQLAPGARQFMPLPEAQDLPAR